MGTRLSRRRLFGALSALTGGLAVGRYSWQAAAQTPTPEIPEDPTKVLGEPLSQVGERSPFVDISRTFADNPTDLASWSFTPLQDSYGIITPSGMHFERHHAGVPLIDPREHRLLIHGLADRPIEYTVEDIKRFPAVSRIMFVECSGNSLYGYDDTAPEDTAQNLHGLVSTSEWVGVPVSTLLEEAGVRPEATWVLAEGADAAVMTRSIPLEKMMDDALIAYGQNGEEIRPEQGYPMRLVLPGWEGNMQIKWLRRLELGDGPYMTREETSKYTDVLPDGHARQFTFVMEAKSVITWPSSGHVIPARGFWEIRGLAWSGRGMISGVEISTDGGETWEEAQLDELVLPISQTRFRFPWEWNGDETVIMSRAIDETGYVQPTKQQLLDARSDGYVYHFNAIQPWRVATDGRVTNALP